MNPYLLALFAWFLIVLFHGAVRAAYDTGRDAWPRVDPIVCTVIKAPPHVTVRGAEIFYGKEMDYPAADIEKFARERATDKLFREARRFVDYRKESEHPGHTRITATLRVIPWPEG